MKIVLSHLNTKKIVIISAISFSFISALISAYYFINRKKKKYQSKPSRHDYSKSNKSLSHSNSQLSQQSSSKLSNRKYNFSNSEGNLPSEELLELGINYLNQAIKCWETALDSIESASYMKSKLPALPSNEHSNLVFKLRTLLDRANDVNLNCTHKLLNSSKTLQIIQTRLSYKQQQYTAALLNVDVNLNVLNYLSDDEEIDEEDNESFVSATSVADWRVLYDEFNLYDIGIQEVNENKVTCRVLRTQMLSCQNDKDFLAKLYAIRLGFDKLLEDSMRRKWLIDEGRKLLTNLFIATDRDPTNLCSAYDNMIKYATLKSNWSLIKDELETRNVLNLNFFDIVIDFILLDSFEDLENPPSAITAVINNRWLSQNFKESALSTAVWSVLKAKRRLLKYNNGFISHFYSLNEHLAPALAWGFLGTDKKLNELCELFKLQVTNYLTNLFDLNKMNYSNLEDLTKDIEEQTIYYLDILTNQFT